MPQVRFKSRFKFLRLIATFSMVFSVGAYAAEWRDCEKAKLRELQLQKTSARKTSRRKTRRQQEDRQQSAEELDTWLWKNCREFSYELRQLEQDKM